MYGFSLDTASPQFVLFGLIVALISNVSRSARWRSGVVMLASLVFLGIIGQRLDALIPLTCFLLLGYLGLALLERGWSRSLRWPILSIVMVYIWLKKYTILPAALFIQQPYVTLGLSYIFFRVLHLVIEAGEGNEKQPVGLGRYLLYNLNFTTLVSGPIQRYDAFVHDQFAEEPIKLGSTIVGLQLARIVTGFFKITVLSTLLYTIHEDALGNMHPYFPLPVRFIGAGQLAVSYPFYLYANFSGYIDIVIALARLMRVRLPENFDRPFSATSFIDFWNRWHITLSTWLRTYVYNPLLVALMRRIPSLAMEPFLAVFCFFVTFFLVGVWHGRTSEFVFFGVLQGGGVAINKLWQLGLARALGMKRYRTLARSPAYVSLARGLTFSWFAFTLFWFWADWGRIYMSVTHLASCNGLRCRQRFGCLRRLSCCLRTVSLRCPVRHRPRRAGDLQSLRPSGLRERSRSALVYVYRDCPPACPRYCLQSVLASPQDAHGLPLVSPHLRQSI